MFQIDPATEAKLAKPVACGLVAALADRFYAGTPKIQQNLAFAASVAAGVFAADMIAPHLPGNTNMVERSLKSRALELGVTAGAAFAMDRYLFNSYPSSYLGSRVMTIIGSEIVGEYVAQSFTGVH